MVTDSTLDSEEETRKISDGKGMENTVDERPEDNPSLTSKMSDASSDTSQAEFPPQPAMIWIMVSVAVGLLTIYTMINWISNKITQQVEIGKKTEEQTIHKQKKTTETFARGKKDTTAHNTCCWTSNHKTNLLENESESNEKDSSANYSFENLTTSDISARNVEMKDESSLGEEIFLVPKDILDTENSENNLSQRVNALSDSNNNHQHKIFQEFESMYQSHTATGEKSNDSVNRLDTNEQSRPVDGKVECQSCRSNGHLISVHLGPGFSGNLSISSGASADCGDVYNINDEITEDETICRSTATLRSYNACHTTPVTVNYIQTKCLTCCAEVSKNGNTDLKPSVKHLLDCNETQSVTDYQKIPKDITGAKLQVVCSTTESTIDGSQNQPSSTTNYFPTTLKSVSCDEVAYNDQPKRQLASQLASSDFEPFSPDTTVGFKDILNSGDIKENKIAEPDKRISLQCFSTESTYSQPKDTVSEAVTTTASSSLKFLKNCNALQETTDGSLISNNSPEETFIFPLDNDTAHEKRVVNCSKERTELETPRTRFQRSVRDNPALSKSLDSQLKSLEKGCKLLEKKPSKSALRSVGSEVCLKKFVHFPEDIRNIRTVYKYHSFDESWYDFDADDVTKNVEQ